MKGVPGRKKGEENRMENSKKTEGRGEGGWKTGGRKEGRREEQSRIIGRVRRRGQNEIGKRGKGERRR